MLEYQHCTREGDHVEGQRRQEGRLGSDTWVDFSADWNLLLISTALERDWHRAYPAIWSMQDGFGGPGSGPNYDWSGIRDSSEEAIERMAEFARTIVSDEEMEGILKLEVTAR